MSYYCADWVNDIQDANGDTVAELINGYACQGFMGSQIVYYNRDGTQEDTGDDQDDVMCRNHEREADWIEDGVALLATQTDRLRHRFNICESTNHNHNLGNAPAFSDVDDFAQHIENEHFGQVDTRPHATIRFSTEAARAFTAQPRIATTHSGWATE